MRQGEGTRRFLAKQRGEAWTPPEAPWDASAQPEPGSEGTLGLAGLWPAIQSWLPSSVTPLETDALAWLFRRLVDDQDAGSSQTPKSALIADPALPEPLRPALLGLLEHGLAPILTEAPALGLMMQDAGGLYLGRNWQLESELATLLSQRLGGDLSATLTPQALSAAKAQALKTPFVLSPAQKAAVELAATQRLTLITGGPGTGKTTLVLSLIRLFSALGCAPIRLLAPTGKAAHRIEASLREQAREISDAVLGALPKAETLHRALGLQPRLGRFVHGPDNPMPGQAVIVDEASMIDLALFRSLLGALEPDARLILLGDADQLPSVQLGSVLSELVASEALKKAHVHLDTNFRVDRAKAGAKALITVAEGIREQRRDLFEGPEWTAITRLEAAPEAGASFLDLDAEGPEALLEAWYQAHLRDFEAEATRCYPRGPDGFSPEVEAQIRARLQVAESAKLLTVTKGQSLEGGSEGINRWMHQRLTRGQSWDFAPGEPVIVEQNDYGLGLFNGDQGLVLWTQDGDAPPRRMAVFDGEARLLSFPLGRLQGRIAPAFAITVHRAQGSETASLLLMLPKQAIPLFTREILYTAVTRARRQVVIAGRREVAALGLSRRATRSSGLKTRLDRP